MKMKKIGILAFVALFTMSISVSAQDTTRQKTTPREMKWTAAQRAEQMAKQLELTAEQKAQVEKVLEKQDAQRAEQMAKAREMRETQQATREEMRAERQKQIEANDAELEQIIGKEKMDQWKAIRAERMRNMRNGNGMRGNKPKVGK
jgi:Spy/CpxP family protein refolding chaperone